MVSKVHKYEEVSMTKLKHSKSTICQTFDKVDVMEDDVVYSIPTSAVMKMDDCEAYGVLHSVFLMLY